MGSPRPVDPVLRVKPITILEQRAVIDNIRSIAKILLSGTHLKVWEDNQVVASILNAMTSKSRQLSRELRVLYRFSPFWVSLSNRTIFRPR